MHHLKDSTSTRYDGAQTDGSKDQTHECDQRQSDQNSIDTVLCPGTETKKSTLHPRPIETL